MITTRLRGISGISYIIVSSYQVRQNRKDTTGKRSIGTFRSWKRNRVAGVVSCIRVTSFLAPLASYQFHQFHRLVLLLRMRSHWGLL